MLRCSPPIAPDPPSGVDSHVPDARSDFGTHSRLDYGNAVLVGIPLAYLVHRLQSVQRGGTTHLPSATTGPHLSDVLATLHWLRVPERACSTIAVLTFKVLHDSAPRYLGPLVAVADLPSRRTQRPTSTSRLVVPPIKRRRSVFPVAAAEVWNGLPEAVVYDT